MRMGGGPLMWGKFEYVEISAPKKIVFVNSFSEEQGAVRRAPFSSAWPLELLNVLTLAGEGEQTLLTLRAQALNASPEEQRTFAQGQGAMRQGFGGTLERLSEFLAQAQPMA